METNLRELATRLAAGCIVHDQIPGMTPRIDRAATNKLMTQAAEVIDSLAVKRWIKESNSKMVKANQVWEKKRRRLLRKVAEIKRGMKNHARTGKP